jgi:hypothetical protein
MRVQIHCVRNWSCKMIHFIFRKKRKYFMKVTTSFVSSMLDKRIDEIKFRFWLDLKAFFEIKYVLYVL